MCWSVDRGGNAQRPSRDEEEESQAVWQPFTPSSAVQIASLAFHSKTGGAVLTHCPCQ